jgi:TorA maturation chaperone TorD
LGSDPALRPIPVTSALDEETARAEIYGLLAQLYYSAAPPPLLEALRVAPTEAPAAGAFLEEPWRELVAAARLASDDAVAAEYADLFGGIGKPEVYLFGSHYVSGFLNDKPLVRLRDDLATLGLARDEAMPETEDHFAYISEVMRYLIAGEDVEVANLTKQREFFSVHVQPWAQQMCEAIAQHPKAKFYASLAGFTRAFLSVEIQGFDLLE